MPLTVSDRLDLADLVHRYAAAVDDRRFDDVVELFTDTGELVMPQPPADLEPVVVKRGHAGVREAMGALTGVNRTQHEIVGEVYSGGPAEAQGRITCVAHHWTKTADGVTDLVWHLRYDDEYQRTEIGWRIQRRALTLNAIETRSIRRLRD
ncbi:nuclear transport factor 2 family protein [Mycobacterium sp. OTB74]|uniref:nuclear transport factor 2 family protein n=1 Tax=Mycobacterium sp. OTB74 TaxID=1853452 RepID=UPI002473997B|nr:nuclear transport factor 2 family protein [Mycobacterium sp. OTB74]